MSHILVHVSFEEAVDQQNFLNHVSSYLINDLKKKVIQTHSADITVLTVCDNEIGCDSPIEPEQTVEIPDQIEELPEPTETDSATLVIALPTEDENCSSNVSDDKVEDQKSFTNSIIVNLSNAEIPLCFDSSIGYSTLFVKNPVYTSPNGIISFSLDSTKEEYKMYRSDYQSGQPTDNAITDQTVLLVQLHNGVFRCNIRIVCDPSIEHEHIIIGTDNIFNVGENISS